MVKVLIVDDERCIQRLYQMEIQQAAHVYEVAGTLISADNVDMFVMAKPVDLILMDINTAEHASGILATERLKRKYPNIKIIVTTSYMDYQGLEQARRAGADSFWFKDYSPIELIQVMDMTMEGTGYWPTELPDVKIGLCSLEGLTKTEREVLSYLAECVSIRKIAEKMYVEEATVKTHLRNICNKTGCENKTELLVMAMQAKVVLPTHIKDKQIASEL